MSQSKSDQDKLDRLSRRLEREKGARQEAERLLEQRSEALYQTNNALLREKEFIRSTLATINDAVVGVDLDGVIIFVNACAEKLCDGIEPELHGQLLSDVLTFVEVGEGEASNKTLNLSAPLQLPEEAIVANRTGETATVALSVLPTYDTVNAHTGFVIAMQDISDVQQMLRRLNRLSKYDPMTALPNRRHFFDILSSHLDLAAKNMLRFALLSIDINNFKRINEWLGQEKGDEVICEMAAVLRHHLRKQDVLCRLNGDEFAVLIADIKQASKPLHLAHELLDQVNAIRVSDSHNLTLSCAIGISLFPAHGEDCNTLLHAADAARLRAKLSESANIDVFDKALSTEYAQQVEIEKMLAGDISDDCFYVLLQPKWDIASKTITGAELLLRCDLPIAGAVAPDQVIRIAESANYICKLGWWIIGQACAAVKRLDSLGYNIPIALNVSALQLNESQFIESLLHTVNANGVAPSSLIIELTESAMLEDPSKSRHLLDRLNQAGFSISIDDFGTGYSSLAYLQHLNVQELKIDKTFVDELNGPSSGNAIVESILTLAKGLDLNVVAEGIEYEAQRQILQSMGCVNGQGYLVSRPVDMDTFITLLQDKSDI